MTQNVEISKRLLLVNSASAAATRIINISVLVWLYQFLLRRISPQEYSLYPVVMSVMLFVPLLTTIFTSGLGRYTVEAYARGDERGVTQIVSTMFPVLSLMAAFILFGGWAFAWHVDEVLTVAEAHVQDARWMMGLLFSLTAARLLAAPFTLGFYIRQRFVLQNVLTVAFELFRIALLFALLFGVSVRVLWVVVSTVAAESCHMGISILISRRLLPSLRIRWSEIRWDKMRSLISFGGWSFVLQVADKIRTNADVIILNQLATAVDVANFHVGSMFYRHLQMTSYLVRAPLQPQVTALHATGDGERLRTIYLRGGRCALWACLFLSLPMMIYRREIVTLYVGPKYLDAATVMALLMVTFPLAYGNVMMPHIAQARAEIRPWAVRAIIMHSVNLALTLYLVGMRGMGAVGSALGTFIVYAVFEPLFYWPLGLRMAGVSVRAWIEQTLRPGFLPAAVALPVWIGLELFVRPQTWWSLGSCVLAGMVCFAACLFGFALRAQDRRDLRQLLAHLQSRLEPVRT